MQYKLPHTITNHGEKLIFQRIEQQPEGETLIGESFCQPGCGPIMHTHFKQDEGMTIVSGVMGYQVLGEEPKVALPGESVVFKRGTAHRFWAEGSEPLHCKAWLRPVNTIIFFLSSVFAAQMKSGSNRPEKFDGAFLLTRYASEYEMAGIPKIVRKVVIPLTYQLGKVLGKYKHFSDAPDPM